MKVLHFKTTYLNISEIFISRIINNHQKAKPFIATCYKNKYIDNCVLYEMPHNGLEGIQNKLQLALNKTPSFLYKVVERIQPDIIHGHFGLDSYRLLGLSQRTNIPLICNFYGYDVTRLPNEWGWKQRYRILKNKATQFIAGSEDMKLNLQKLGFPEDKISVIKLGMDIKSIRHSLRKKSGPSLMIIGRLVEKKGIEYAIKAISILKDKYPTISLDVFGDGNLSSNLKGITASLNIKNHVNFKGMTPNNIIFKELYKHDILLVPSVQAADGDREGIPQTTVEGMATGIPVIASDHAGLPELVHNRETGLKVTERNENEIAEAIRTYIDTPNLVKKVSKKAREKVFQEHDIHKQVAKIEQLYKSVINNVRNNL